MDNVKALKRESSIVSELDRRNGGVSRTFFAHADTAQRFPILSYAPGHYSP